MEATVCQAAETNVAEIIAKTKESAESMSTLTSAEMSFVGGGSLAVIFA
jgi:hypothetical protein